MFLIRSLIPVSTAIGITFWLIPETKGVTLEHIERKLMSGEKLRNIGV